MYSNKFPIDAKELVIFGTEDLASLAHYYIRLDYPEVKIVGHTVDREFLKQEKFEGVSVIAWEELEKHYPPGRVKLFLPLVQKEMGGVRARKYDEAKRRGYRFINYISPRATVYAGTVLGDNNFVFEDNTIQPFTQIQSNNIFWSGNHIGHHGRIGNHNFITSHVVISGHVTIGDGCYFGVNSTIRDGIRIADRTLVGMGTIIHRDTQENSVYSTPGMKAREGVVSTEML
jgi:sugar O-acyltransferase (sialic acid O-acetyltransferase NeuD family)